MSRANGVEFTAAQRSLRARLAAYRSWERTTNAAARTAPARRAAIARFDRQVDPEGVLIARGASAARDGGDAGVFHGVGAAQFTGAGEGCRG
jgi:hypothetical protein